MDINAPIEIVFQVIANPQNFVKLESVVQKVEIIGDQHGKGMITRWHIQDSNTGKNIINDEIKVKESLQFALEQKQETKFTGSNLSMLKIGG